MKRIFGLDLIRAIAILSVLICHTMLLLYPFTSGITELLFNLSTWAAGFYGVEIFFVLSGFLIGNIFIKKVVFDKTDSSLKLLITDFWMRRWVRTLPNYFLFLLINLLLIPINPDTAIKAASTLKYFVFLQCLLPNSSPFFGVSWSLAVEEWFYLLLPVLFTISLLFLRKRTKAFFISLLLLLLLPGLLKIFYAFKMPLYSDIESVYHYGTFFKLDSIFYGLLLAWLWNKDGAKQWLIEKKKPLLFLGFAGIIFSLIYAFLFVIKPIQNSVLVILFAPITSIAISMFFPFLHEWQVKENRLTKGITFISLISYSLYLVHVPLIIIYRYLSKNYHWPTDFISSIAAFMILNILSILIASILYKRFEMPILGYREQIGKMLTGKKINSKIA